MIFRIRPRLSRALAALLCASVLAGGARAATIEHLDLESLRGKVVMIDFWASWCAPCKESFPWMQRMQERYGPQGLVIVAVNLDHDRHLADAFLRHQHPSFSILYNTEGDLAERYHVEVMPSSFLLDRRGRQRIEHRGFEAAERDGVEKQLRELLSEPSPADDADGPDPHSHQEIHP
jgi:thiol-disulfide isomerase/thioredoxin